MIKPITMDDLHDAVEKLGSRLNQDALVIDVRTPSEYARGHVPGSKNFPIDEIDQHVGEIKTFKEIYIYCHAGGRVDASAEILTGHGVTDLQCVLSGGFPNWVARGYPIAMD